jgi:small subunit ribosomal protein S1
MENFAQLFEESISKESNSNQVQSGRVVKITDKYVVVDLCTKSESFIDINEFKDANGNLEVKVGDDVQVELVANDNGYGETEASREKAKRQESWQKLEQDYNENKTVRGKINGRVKGGFTVEIDNIRAFLPGSLVDVRTNGNNQNIDGQEFDFKVIKLDQKRNNVVVSRKAVLENENSSERKEFLASIEEGKVIEGTVKNLAEYGAFVDLGFNVDGLLHITDMAWKRVKHPSEIVNVGDKIKVKVLKYEPESTRVSLGLKQLGEDPWQNIAERFPVGEKLKGKVTNLAEYGCFVEIADGVEGLVHVSEMDWTNKNVHPSKVVSVGDEVEVKVLEIIPEKRRISLGLKQCKPNPWQEFAEKHNKGDKVTGSIKSITDFGIFIGLEGGIDGLVHLSDISWSVPGDEAVRDYKKNDEVTAVVLQVHPELERISLGIKQLSNDPFGQFVTDTKKNSIVKGTVVSVDAKGAVVDLGNNVEGYIRASEISSERVDDATKVLSKGQEIEAKYVGSDRKNRQVSLSIKAVFEAEEKAVAENIKSENEKAKAETGNAMAEAFKAAKGE